MNKLFENGHAEEAPKDIPPGWTLSLFPAYHPWKPEPRPVYDCAATVNGVSLNSKALSGPNQYNLMLEVFLRFQWGKYRYSGDIATMFYQVFVPHSQRRYLRFWWYPNGDLNQPLKEYQLTVHLFGGTWSPGVTAFALRKAALDQAHLFPEKIINAILNQFYVDDYLNSAMTSQDGVTEILGVQECLKNKGFNLTKFMANSKDIIRAIPNEHRAAELKNMDLDIENLPIDRALGQHWNAETDEIIWLRKTKSKPNTKRGVLSTVSSVFDPCGYLAPVVLEGKLIFQSECREAHDWDTPLSEENLKRWEKWLDEIKLLDQFRMPCGIFSPKFGEATEVQLHNFADGSSVAFGSAHYVRGINSQGEINVRLVLAKSRLKPLSHRQNLTIPKTELQAAVQAVELSQALESYLNIENLKQYYWTDSTITLSYIKCLPGKRMKVYVQNRLSFIWLCTAENEWGFVCSEDNPADLCSKSKTVKSFLKAKDMWIYGPEFLWKNEDEWPVSPIDIPKADEIANNQDFAKDQRPRQQRKTLATPPEKDNDHPCFKIMKYYTKGENESEAITAVTFLRIKRSIAWLVRVIKEWRERRKRPRYNLRSKRKEKKELKPLDADELQHAERILIITVQKHHLGPYEKKQVSRSNGEKIEREGLHKKHSLQAWKPYTDKHGVMRIKTRVRGHRPILIPDDSVLADVLIVHYHNRCGHGGREYTISVLTRKGFWMRRPRRIVSRCLKICPVCQRLNAKPLQPSMADLPPDRTTLPLDGAPWTVTGLDPFGPYDVQVGLRSRRYEKRWGLLFTCAASRAVHLEPLWSMDQESFLMAMVRFQSRRAFPKLCRSDNGSNITAGDKALNAALRDFHKNEHVQKELASLGIKWLYNSPAAPNQGGFWERLVGVVKRIFEAIMPHNCTLNDEKFNTLLIEVEDIINNRPLTPNPESPLESPPLTPNDLIKIGSSLKHPAGIFKPGDMYVSRWRHVMYLAQEWWVKWRDQYLPMLYKQSKWHKESSNLKVGEMVLLLGEPGTHRHNYPIGRVIEVYPGEDGVVRNVKIKCRERVLKRPTNKLCRFEGVLFPPTN